MRRHLPAHRLLARGQPVALQAGSRVVVLLSVRHSVQNFRSVVVDTDGSIVAGGLGSGLSRWVARYGPDGWRCRIRADICLAKNRRGDARVAARVTLTLRPVVARVTPTLRPVVARLTPLAHAIVSHPVATRPGRPGARAGVQRLHARSRLRHPRCRRSAGVAVPGRAGRQVRRPAALLQLADVLPDPGADPRGPS